MIGNGGQYDSTLTTSGDYCNEYGMELFNEPISDDLSQWTGFTTPTPHSSYTVGSGYGGICEASGDTWGQMAVSDSQNECSGAVCGVHHFASLGGLSGSDRPFAAAFGDPTLRVQGHFDAGGYRGSAGGWAYLCPILKDMSIPTGRTTSVGNTIELCVEEWLPSPDSTGWPQHDYVQCNSNFLNGHPFDTVITTLQSGMRFATPDAASHTTVTNGALGDNLYAADFTASNLQNVITAINSQCTGQSYSSTLADYGLLGIEQGEEEWRNEYILGGSEAALYATTMH